MRTFHIYSDLHLGTGNYEWKGKIEERPSTILLGDIVEMKNISKKDVPKQLRLLKDLNSRFFCVRCNHSCSAGKILPEFVKFGEVLFIHGHQVKWDAKKIDKWYNKKPGRNSLGVLWSRLKRSKYKESKPKKLSQKDLQRCYEIAKFYNCKTVVLGHTHNTDEQVYKGVRIINVGRGYTRLEL